MVGAAVDFSLSSTGSLGPPTFPKLWRHRTPHIPSSALHVYSVHHFPVSCCRLNIILLEGAAIPRGDSAKRLDRGSEMAATMACKVGDSLVE